jgi:hypothetical protein
MSKPRAKEKPCFFVIYTLPKGKKDTAFRRLRGIPYSEKKRTDAIERSDLHGHGDIGGVS